MKVMLVFDLPVENEEFEDAHRGGDWRAALHEVDESLRGKIKHGHGCATVEEALRLARAEILRATADRNLRLL